MDGMIVSMAFRPFVMTSCAFVHAWRPPAKLTSHRMTNGKAFCQESCWPVDFLPSVLISLLSTLPRAVLASHYQPDQAWHITHSKRAM